MVYHQEEYGDRSMEPYQNLPCQVPLNIIYLRANLSDGGYVVRMTQARPVNCSLTRDHQWLRTLLFCHPQLYPQHTTVKKIKYKVHARTFLVLSFKLVIRGAYS